MGEHEVVADGAELAAMVGDDVIVRLPENPTTGYQWRIDELPTMLNLLSTDFMIAAEPAPGAGGQRIIRFRATRSGVARVRMVLARSWETHAAPQRTYGFSIRVQ